MDFIKDKAGKVVLAFDADSLYFHSQEPDEDSEFENSITIHQIRDENNGVLKLFTLLDLQEELDIISDKNFIVSKIRQLIPQVSHSISKHEEFVSNLANRIILLKLEFSGPASGGISCLFLDGGDKRYDLSISNRPYLSASEILEYYGLGENEYWDQIQANGEFIESTIPDIETGKELYNGIALLLKNDENWNLEEHKINWVEISETLMNNHKTSQLGTELKSIITKD